MRGLIQSTSAVLMNGHISGFITGRIYTGKLKIICVPGMNCYSCPGAVGSCPIGALQAVVGSLKYSYSLYIMGFMMMIGSLSGRYICGWICPFGLFQDVLAKIPSPKWKLPKWTVYLKYVSLFMVVIGPLIIVNKIGMGTPVFCKWVCPVGTIEGGVPLTIMQPALRAQLGFLFGWKMMIAVLVIVLSIVLYRPFCKVLCPLGLILGWFNRISIIKLHVNHESCTSCGLGEKLVPLS